VAELGHAHPGSPLMRANLVGIQELMTSSCLPGSVRGEPAVVQRGADRLVDGVQRVQRVETVVAGEVGGAERRALAHVGDDAGDGAEHAGLGDAELQGEQLAAAVDLDEPGEVFADEVLEALAGEHVGHLGVGRVDLGEGDSQRLRDTGSREVDDRRLQSGDAGQGGAEQC